MIQDPGQFQITLKLFLLREDQLLILEDRHDRVGDLPGGRINQNEFFDPFHRTLAREVREELGTVKCSINPDPVFCFQHFVQKDQKQALGLAFVGAWVSGEITLSEEHSGMDWVDCKTFSPGSKFVAHMLAAVERFQKDWVQFRDSLRANNTITLP